MRSLPNSLRWMLALGVVATIGVALFVRSATDGDGGSAATLAESGVEPAQPNVSSLNDDAAVDRAEPEVERTAVPEPEDESERPRRRPRPGTGKVWKGVVEYVGRPAETTAALGSMGLEYSELTLEFHCFGKPYPETVELLADKFECVVPYAAEDIERVVVARASAQGTHWLAAAGFESLAPEFDTVAAVRLERAPATLLKVVDAESGALLDGFSLELQGLLSLERDKRSFEREIVAVGGPPNWAETDGRVRLRVTAPGRSTREVNVDLDTGGTHEIRMERGAIVAVRWVVPEELRRAPEAAADWPDLTVGLETSRAKPLSRRSLGDAVIYPAEVQAVREDSAAGRPEVIAATVEAVPPGEYRAVLRTPDVGLARSRELAAARFTVLAGGTKEVELATHDDHGFPPRVRSFEIELPADYGAVEKLELLLRHWEKGTASDSYYWTRLTAHETAPRVWCTAPTRVDLGTYLAGLSIDRNVMASVEVADGSATPIRIQLPPRHRYRVRLQCPSSEMPSVPRALRWRTVSTLGVGRVTRVGASQDVYEILASAAAIEINVPSPGSMRLAAGEWVRLEGGGEHVLNVLPGPCVRLVLHENGQPFDTPRSFSLVRATDSDGYRHVLDTRRVQPSPGAAHELLVWFRQSGEHELELLQISRFEPFAPLKLTVTEGPERVVHLDLVRKR